MAYEASPSQRARTGYSTVFQASQGKLNSFVCLDEGDEVPMHMHDAVRSGVRLVGKRRTAPGLAALSINSTFRVTQTSRSRRPSLFDSSLDGGIPGPTL